MLCGSVQCGCAFTVDAGLRLDGNGDAGSPWSLRPVLGETCIAIRNSQTIASGGNVTISFTDADEYDPGLWHSTSTNPDQIVVPFDGTYLLVLEAYLTSVAAAGRYIFGPTYNGASLVTPGGVDLELAAPPSLNLGFSSIRRASAGGYFGAFVFQDSGADEAMAFRYSVTLLREDD